MDDSVLEISTLTRKISRACSCSRTRRHQCLALFSRCSQIDAYLLAWYTGFASREDFSSRATAELAACFRRCLALVRASASESWLQQALVRQHGEHEFQRILEDLEMLVDIIFPPSALREAAHHRIRLERLDSRDQLREAATQDRTELITRIMDNAVTPPELAPVSEHLLHKLKNSENVVNDLGFDPLTVDPRSIRRDSKLGRGSSGEVYRATWLGHPVAVKVFDWKDSSFSKELQAMSELVRPHPHVLQMFCTASKPHHEHMIVMELMKMDLKKFLDRRPSGMGSLPIVTAVDILLQIARGTRHLHEHKIVHRDLKPQNVLVDFDESDQDNVSVLLTDFGIARTEFDTLVGEMTHLRGTPRYMAPEILLVDEMEMPRYSRKVDVFSFGILASEVLTGSPPYGQENPDMSRLRKMLTNGRRPQLPENCPGELAELIRRCWDMESDKRPTFKEIESELVKIKKQLLVPPELQARRSLLTSFSMMHMSYEGRSTSSLTSYACSSTSSPPNPSVPGVEELTIMGTEEVGSTLTVHFRPRNGAKYIICRWSRKGGTPGASGEVRKPVMVICSSSQGCESFRELELNLTAADFKKRLVLDCLPLNNMFRTGRLVSKSTGIVGFGSEEAIKTSWENGQASFKVIRLHPKWWESTGKLFINRKDYYLWWGQGNPQNLRFLFADAMEEDDSRPPLELSDEGPLLCNLRKSDGTLCVVKFASPSARDNAVLTMKFFWEKRRVDSIGAS